MYEKEKTLETSLLSTVLKSYKKKKYIGKKKFLNSHGYANNAEKLLKAIKF